jgi:hypothetical protein
MTRVLKFVDVYVRQLENKELEENRWYFDELDRILDDLFEEAVKQGLTNWSDFAAATKQVDGKGLARQTIVNLGERWTKRPQMRTVLLIAAAVGKEVVVKKSSRTARPALGLRSA